MKQIRFVIRLTATMMCLLLLAVGCARQHAAGPEVERQKQVPEVTTQTVEPAPQQQEPQVAVEPAPPPIQPQQQEPQVVEPNVAKPKVTEPNAAEPKVAKPKVAEPNVPPSEVVTLALKFTPEQLTTYKVITEAQRTIKWEGPLPDKSVFKGGTTSSTAEITFAQRIESVDDQGNAIAKIIIKDLKYRSIIKDSTVLDFDSSREKDMDSPMAKLIDQSYTIQISPAGQVSKVIDVSQAQAAVKGTSLANKTALTLLMTDTIKERHTISALPAAEKADVRTGDQWNLEKSFSFGMMGSKSYEKNYSLKEVKDANGGRIAVVQMNATPGTETPEQLQNQAAGFFSKMFDNTEDYTGQLKLDLATGQVHEYLEKLKSEWVAVDPTVAQQADKQPAVLKMTAIRLYHLRKID